MIKTSTTRPMIVNNNNNDNNKDDNKSNNNSNNIYINNRQTSMVDEHECVPCETSCSTSDVNKNNHFWYAACVCHP